MTSIRTRLLLVLLSVGLIPMLVVMFVTNHRTRDSLEHSEREKIAAVTYEVARQARLVMDSAVNDLVALRGNRIVTDSSIPMDIRVEEMRRLVAAYKMFDDITLYDSKGRMVRSTTNENHPEPIDKTLWFKRCISDQNVITSRPHHVVGEEGLHLKVYIPLNLASSVEQFVLRARLKFDPMWDLIDGIKIGERGEALLLDPRGRLIAGRDKNMISRPYFVGGATPFWNQNKGYVNLEGDDFYFHSEILSIEDTGVGEAWVVACLRPRAEVLAVVSRAVTLQSRIAILVCILTGLIGFWLSKMIANPIVRASSVARRVEDGELSVRMQEQGASEIKQLGVSFNAMIDQVRNHRYGLEAMVDSRTKSLKNSQKELEGTSAQLRASYEAARDGIIVIDVNGDFIAANQRIVDYFKVEADLDSFNVLTFAQKVKSSFHKPEQFIAEWMGLNNSPTKTEEIEWVMKTPAERVLSVYSSPVLLPDGMQIARFWSFHDVTEERRLQKGLEQAQKMEAVGRLAGGVAHDFNNLLTGIIGNLSLVKTSENGSSNADSREFIVSAKRASQRAAELVKQLLGFSRQSHLELDYCRVNEVIDEVMGLLKSTTDPRISISSNCSENLWTVEADGTQVEQVIMNLCVNAIDAIDYSDGRIEVKTQNVGFSDKELNDKPGRKIGEYVMIVVSDNGTGMSSETKAKLFEPFFTTKEQGKGTGLGLATSYGIVEQHGGWIECDSDLGVGSNFSIFLPRKDAPIRKPSPVVNDVCDTADGDETVLVVDDEDVVRKVAEGALKAHGFKTLSASNGKEALEILDQRSSEVMLVLLDLTMPIMSGKETLALIRERFEGMPVIVCSGYMVDLQGFEDETGFMPDAAIQKPYNIKSLASKIRELIDDSQAPLFS
ncbi:MAG: ATP-binding protein [Verrucomicrobiales bacterium]